jgi:LmbE family N-acetylglucosaminyl deacetylase
MGSLVVLHAHPDDESIQTGGTMAKAAADGHRVTLVIATRGEHGEVVPGVLDDGEPLGLRRIAETYESAALLGAHRVEFLGYVDSGMMGEPTNDAPASFWQADVDHAARRLAVILDEEQADVLTYYDEIGGYGHPDHIQVHRVGRRAGELAGVPRRYMATMNRDFLVDLIRARMESGDIDLGDVEAPEIDEENFGQPAARITHRVDVSEVIDAKRASMRAHASQIGEEHFFSALPDEAFALSFGQEWFIEDDEDGPAGGEPFATDLFG